MYVLLTFAASALITVKVKKNNAASATSAVAQAKGESWNKVAAQCPAAYDTKDPGEFGKEYISEGVIYEHCKKCLSGVYMNHPETSVRACTFCGKLESEK